MSTDSNLWKNFKFNRDLIKKIIIALAETLKNKIERPLAYNQLFESLIGDPNNVNVFEFMKFITNTSVFDGIPFENDDNDVHVFYHDRLLPRQFKMIEGEIKKIIFEFDVVDYVRIDEELCKILRGTWTKIKKIILW